MYLQIFVFCFQLNSKLLLDQVYALYDYDGSINNSNNKSNINRFSDRHIKVNEGDELEIIEDDDEHMWKVNS
jgi:hypothetical protein